jgi:MFS family permease
MTARGKVGRTLSPFRHRNFRLFWIGFASSNTGRWCELTGALWLVSELTASPVSLGLLGLARGLPSIALFPVAGVIADRFDQRKTLFVTQAAQMVGSLCLGLLVVSGQIQVWHIYLLIAAQASIGTFDWAARNALFPRLIPSEQLPDGVTLSATAGRTSQFLGPLIGGLAIAAVGTAAPFFLNAVTNLALMSAVLLMNGVARHLASERQTFRTELMAGVRQTLGSPVIGGLLKLELVAGVFQLNPVIITIIGLDVLDVGPEGLGLLLASPAIGSLVGVGALLAVGQSAKPGQFVLVCLALYSAIVAVFGFSSVYAASILLLAVAGLLDVMMTVTRLSIVQLAAPSHMRGRVMANMGMVVMGTGPLAQTQSGLLAAAIGPAGALVTAAAALLSTAVGVARTNPELRRFAYAEDVTESSRAPLASQESPAD